MNTFTVTLAYPTIGSRLSDIAVNGTAFEYFEWKERPGIIQRIAHYVFPSPIAVAWLVVIVAVCAAVALATMQISLPGGW